MSQNEFERRELHFSGHVQGVGFRYTTYRIATNYQVTGFVRNLPDGRVRLVVEGSAEQIDAFVAAIQSALGNNIHDIEITRQAWSGEFSRFEIER